MLCAEDGTEITWLPYVTNDIGKIQLSEGIEEGCYVKVVGVPIGYKLDESVKYQFDSTGNFRRYSGGETYKEYLERFLFGNDSPYKDMSIGFKEDLACKINQIKEIKHSRKVLFGEFNKLYDAGYDFIYFVEEPEEINRIKSNFVNVVQNLSNEKLINIK